MRQAQAKTHIQAVRRGLTRIATTGEIDIGKQDRQVGAGVRALHKCCRNRSKRQGPEVLGSQVLDRTQGRTRRPKSSDRS